MAAHGFAVLALAYFAYEDLPNLLEVDLDYFEEAANLLLAHPKVFKVLLILPCNITVKDKKILRISILPILPICLDLGIAKFTMLISTL